jgi:Ca2+-binding EF-hand superfamily protein
MVSSVSSNSSLWASQVANANSAAQRHKEMFERLDANSDGKIDTSELKAGLPTQGNGKDAAAIMKEVDTSGDGVIDEGENDAFLTKMESNKKAGGPPPGAPPAGGPPPGGGGMKSGSSSVSATKIFDKLDTNKDGKVSLQELMAAINTDETESDATDLLKQIDSDSDGSISKDEFNNYLTKLEKQLDTIIQVVQSYSEQGTTQNDSTVGGTVNTLA